MYYVNHLIAKKVFVLLTPLTHICFIISSIAFNFETGNHDIVKVPKESFNACTSSNAIGKVITNGPANVTLETVGEHYYICSAGQHCQHGQKLSISISATPGGVSPTPANTPTTPTTLSPTPTSHDPITPNAPSPSNSVNSSVLKVFVGVLVPIMSLIIGLLF